MEFMDILKTRFAANLQRHPDIDWETVEKCLKENPGALEILQRMEETGGEPDVIGREEGKILFCDCSRETPGTQKSVL